MSYQTPENNITKAEWRRAVYTSVCSKNIPQTVLLIPDSMGAELDIAREFGIPIEGITCVNKSPAIVANVRKRYPRVKDTVGLPLKTALTTRLAGRKFDFINADLCSNLRGDDIKKTIRTCASALQSGRYLSLTLMFGRDQVELHYRYMFCDSLTNKLFRVRKEAIEKFSRLVSLAAILNGQDSSTTNYHPGTRCFDLEDYFVYTSNRAPMLWSLWSLDIHEHARAQDMSQDYPEVYHWDGDTSKRWRELLKRDGKRETQYIQTRYSRQYGDKQKTWGVK